MTRQQTTPTQLFVLYSLAALPRIIGALWLPNAFGDAYAYTEQVYYMRRALLAGTFTTTKLFGFWLPLYQFVCAIVSAFVGGPFYVPKLISAVSGAGVCLIVFLLTLELTANRLLSLASFAMVAVNPYHIFYSASAMTDVPHAFFILLCAYCCIRDRWLLAALFGLAAGLIRIESWTLVAIIPALQVIRTRRLSVLACITLLFGPAFWLYVSWEAGGSPWRYFEIRNDYIVETLTANPWLGTFAPWRVALDLVRLIYTANPLVILACCAGVLLTIRRWKNRSSLRINPQFIILIFYFSHLFFLLLAYFTRNQAEIWPRYGLIFFSLGLPILVGQVLRHNLIQTTKSEFQNTKMRMAYFASTLFALQFCIQLIDVTRITAKSDPNRIAAEFIEDEHLADGSMKIYCEDGAIRVLSGIPLEEFKDQYNSPADTESFLRSLRENQVRLLVYKDLPGSRLGQIIRQIKSGTLNSRRSGITLEEVTVKPRQKPSDSIVLYRVHANEVASKK
jgi:hypothetical protein